MVNLTAVTPQEWWLIGIFLYVVGYYIAYSYMRRCNRGWTAARNSTWGTKYNWSHVLGNIAFGLLSVPACIIILLIVTVTAIFEADWTIPEPPKWL